MKKRKPRIEHRFAEAIGAALMRRRVAAGLEQKDLSWVICVSDASYSRIETGVTVCSIFQLYFLARFLNADLKELLDEAQADFEKCLAGALSLPVILKRTRVKHRQFYSVPASRSAAL